MTLRPFAPPIHQGTRILIATPNHVTDFPRSATSLTVGALSHQAIRQGVAIHWGRYSWGYVWPLLFLAAGTHGYIDTTTNLGLHLIAAESRHALRATPVLTRCRPGATKWARMPKTRYRAALAVFVTLWVAVLALGDIVRGIHLLAEHHVVCLEHGELMEPVDPAGAITLAGLQRQHPAFTRQHSTIEHHAHCAIAARPANLQWLATPPSLAVSRVEMPRGRAVVVFDGIDVPHRPMLTNAPKQSPPV